MSIAHFAAATPSEQAAAASTPSLSFSAVGDFGSKTSTDSVLSAIRARNDNLTLALGDLSYGTVGTEPAWCSRVTNALGSTYPFELISGNHESNGANGLIENFAACLPDKLGGVQGTYGRQYYVDMPKAAPLVRFIMVSPNLQAPDGTWWDYSAGSPRYQWTAAAIDKARAAGIPWVVVGQHIPCLSLGSYGCDPRNRDLMNLYVAKRVDLVLQGHEHLYQRTKQLAQSSACPNVPTGTFLSGCVAGSGAAMTKGAGTVFATVGTGGHELLRTSLSDAESGYFATSSGSTPSDGSLAVQVTADRLSAQFAPVSSTGYRDSFTLTRAGATTPTPAVMARDTFTRAVSSGWGQAEVGGTWTSSSPAATSVSGTAGVLTLTKGSGVSTTLDSVRTTGADLRFSVALRSVPVGGSGWYQHVIVRRVGSMDYRARLRILPSGAVTVTLVRSSGTTETALTNEVQVASGYQAGSRLQVRVQATGAAPTTVRAKVWAVGTSEPSTWAVNSSDTMAGLQTAGSVGWYTYLSGSTTNGPLTATVDDLTVTTP